MAKDPVCGMHVDEKTPGAMSKFEGKTFYFCCPVCKSQFDKNPSKFKI